MKRRLQSIVGKLAAIALVLSMSGSTAFAQLTASQAFVKAPASLLPTLDTNTRMDMVDYFAGGVSTPSPTSLNGEAIVTAMDERSIEVRLSDNGRMQLSPVRYGKDTAIVVVTTTEIPAADSRVELYSWPEWKLIDNVDSGTVQDWLNASGKKSDKGADVENVLGFMTAEATFDPSSMTVTFVPTMSAVIGEDEYNGIVAYIQPTMKVKVSPGKGLVKEKSK